jgi:DNA-binding transcriptional ArsR family regulator
MGLHMNLFENPVRRKIVMLLRESELSAGQISDALRRPRPGISHHLALLAEAGLIARRFDGPFRYYKLDMPATLTAWNEYLGAAESVARA